MNKEKFSKIVSEELNKLNAQPIETPEDWKTAKPVIEEVIKQLDKAAEVYEMENKKGK